MRIIVLGKNGMLGSYVYKYFSKIYIKQVIGVEKSQLTVSRDYNSMVNILDNLISNGDVIINCIGIIPQKSQDLRKMIVVNSQFPLILSIMCKNKDAFCIHPSSDCVFDGKRGKYTSSDTPNDTSFYGITKNMGEIKYPNTVVLRTSIIGEDNGHSLFGWLRSNAGGTINGYTNHLWNGVTCWQYAKEMEKIILTKDFHGIRHFFSKTSEGITDYSKKELLDKLNLIYDLNVEVVPCDFKKSIDRTLKGICVEPSIDQQIYEMKMADSFVKRNICRVCDCQMEEICDIGKICVAGAFHQDPKKVQEIYPFTLGFCKNCCIILCQEVIDPDVLFKSGYFYRSSQIKSLVEHFTEYADWLYGIHGSNKKVLEVGCNDGVFLVPLKNKGFDVVGVDPADDVTADLTSNGYTIYNDYIERSAKQIVDEQGKFDIVVSSNCLAHTPNIKNTIIAIKNLLKPSGSLYIEVHYAGSVFGENQFDFLYHEHMSYYTVSSLYNIAKIFGMTLTSVMFTQLHGKSMRACIVNSKSTEISPQIQSLLEQETNFRDVDYLKSKNSVFQHYRNKIKNVFESYNDSKKYLQYAYGASGRANTICSYCDIKFHKFIDDAKSKIGSYTPVYNVEIHSSNELYKSTEQIKVVWILCWPYAEYILKQLDDFKGIIIIPDFSSQNVVIHTH